MRKMTCFGWIDIGKLEDGGNDNFVLAGSIVTLNIDKYRSNLH